MALPLLFQRAKVNKFTTSQSRKQEPYAMTEDSVFTAQDALVALMVAVSVSDAEVRTSELLTIERIVTHLPVFRDYNPDRLKLVSGTVIAIFEEEEGLDALFGLVQDALPERLYETAYAVACDVAAADGTLRQTELAMLQEIREELQIDRLHAAAIERGSRARHQSL